MQNDLKDFYEKRFKDDSMPQFEDLSDEQRKVLSSSFSYNAFMLDKAAQQFRLNVSAELKRLSDMLREK